MSTEKQNMSATNETTATVPTTTATVGDKTVIVNEAIQEDPSKSKMFVVFRLAPASGGKTAQLLVCTRETQEDAESIARALNEAQEGVFYLRFVSSKGFPDSKGDSEALLARAEDEDLRLAWERFAANQRRDTYLVAEVQIDDEQKAEIEQAKEKDAQIK